MPALAGNEQYTDGFFYWNDGAKIIGTDGTKTVDFLSGHFPASISSYDAQTLEENYRNFTVYGDPVEFLKNHFKENFYLEIQSHNHIAQINFNKHILSLSEQYDIELIHGCDTHWITEDDKFKRKILLSGKGMNYGDEDSFENDYPSYDEILERYRVQGVVSEEQAKSALDNTMIIKEKTKEFVFNDDIKMPTLYPNETHEQKMKRLENILNQEYKRQYGHLSGLERKRYLEAIRYETSIIRNTCMEDYFLLNYYIIKRAKELGMILTQTGRRIGSKFPQ